MDIYPTVTRRFLIQTMMTRYLRILKKAKISYKLTDKQFEDLCDRFINPEYVSQIFKVKEVSESESDSESDSD